MKKYTNLIVIGCILLIALTVFLVKNVDINEVLLAVGYYDERISIINTADMHGNLVFDTEAGGYYSLEEVNVIMGMPLVKSIADDIRSERKDSIFVDSGDTFHGTNESNIGDGAGVVEVINKMGYTAMTPGNHDFNYGFKRLYEISQELNFPMISANIYKDGKPVFEEYKIVQVGNKKVALFGLTTDGALQNMNTHMDEVIEIVDPVKAASKIVPVLRKKADVVVLVSHLGDDVDAKLVEDVAGIDVVLCGHHHFLYEKAKKVNDTYLMEAGGYATHVGFADLYFKNDKLKKLTWHIRNEKDGKKVDKETFQIAEEYHAQALESYKEVLGVAKVKLDGIRSHVRAQETNLADMLADAMREAGNADITLMNGGGIRQSIPDGEVNLYKVGKTLPFVNSLVTVELKGDLIYKALERGLESYPNGSSNGGFLQVSGIGYEFDATKRAGERLVRVLKDGKPLDKDTVYKVAMNDYLHNGGDNYKEFVGAKLLYKGELLKDVLAKYIKKKGEVEPGVEGRIKVLNERYK